MISDYDLQQAYRNLHLLSPDQKARVLLLLEERNRLDEKQKARDQFIAFVKKMWPDVVLGAHHYLMAEAYEKVMSAESKRLIINIAPRHSKSEMTSWLFPLWFMGRNPKAKIMQCMNTQDLASGFGRRVRNTLAKDAIATEEKLFSPYHEIFPDMDLSKDSGASHHWHNVHGGEYYAVGVGGKIAGRGADCAYYSCRCLTNRGYIPIADVRVGDLVKGYDHERQAATWTPVLAISTQRKPEIIDINGFLCTPEHRVYTRRGYRRAVEARASNDDVLSLPADFHQRCEGIPPSVQADGEVPGEAILFRRVQEQSEAARVPGMRELESADGTDLQGLLPERQTRRSDMQSLREGVQAASLGARKEPESVWRYGKRLLRSVLLSGVQVVETGSAATLNRLVQKMRETSAQGAQVLRHGLLQCASATGGWQLSTVLGCVEPGAASHQEAVRREVRNVRSGESSRAGASHRPRLDEPYADQPDTAVRTVPRVLSSADVGVSARDFADVLPGEGHWVVDIQTGTKNFFCEGVLAHNCLIIDDPHSEQEAKMAVSNPDIFDQVYEWYVYGPRQRLQPNGRIIVVQTRWSKRDLTGRLLEKMKSDPSPFADKWEQIEFPAILDEGTDTERALWPEYWPLETQRATRAALPVVAWQSQYQQNPVSAEGAILKRDYWRTWGEDTPADRAKGVSSCPGSQHLAAWNNTEPPACDYIIMSLDSAIKKTERADFSAFTSWGVFKAEDRNTGRLVNNIILLDAFQARMDFPELKLKTRQLYQENMPDTLLIEDKGSGSSLIQELRSMGIPVEAFGYGRGSKALPNDKVARANMVADIFASGYVWAPPRRFADEVITQCQEFPSSMHDDLVDSTVQAMIRFRAGGFISTANDDYDDEEETRRYVRKRFY